MAVGSKVFRTCLFATATFALVACGAQETTKMQAFAPLPQRLLSEMQAKGMSATSPVLVRTYKKEAELEIWKKTASGRFALLKTYPICRWSGQLGPKSNEGDRQVPEGFYSVTPSQMNPNSQLYLSYNIGFPNAVDRSLGRTGSNIMVHGVCSSRGCFAMTNEQISEIYALAREAFKGGQPSFQFQSYPFRMTAENMAKSRLNPNFGFWRNLKEGSDNFEVTRQPVAVASCGGRYVFNGQGGSNCGVPAGDANVADMAAAKQKRDEQEAAALMHSGTTAVAYLFEDGGENSFFRGRLGADAVPGLTVPYTTVPVPSVITLDETGRPASQVDASAATAATYSAAEKLLMAEAALAHRLTGPQLPVEIRKRQHILYAALLGVGLPRKQPSPPEIVAANDPGAQDATGSISQPLAKPVRKEGRDRPLFTRMLNVVGLGAQDCPPEGQRAQSVASSTKAGVDC